MDSITASFRRGITIGNVTHHQFELRAPSVGDLLDAEMECPTSRLLGYQAALAAKVMTRLGNYEGPITSAMFRRLSSGDFAILQKALNEAEQLGEDSPTVPAQS